MTNIGEALNDEAVKALSDAEAELYLAGKPFTAADAYEAVSPFLAQYEEITNLQNQLFDMRKRFCDAERLIAWLDDPKPAITAFTEGNERQIAYRVETMREEITRLREALERIRRMAIDKGTRSGPPDIYWIAQQALATTEPNTPATN